MAYFDRAIASYGVLLLSLVLGAPLAAQTPTNPQAYPDISGEWMEGSDHGVHISQNGGAFTATCTYGNVSWRMEGTVSPDGVLAGRLTHTAGVSQSATGFAQDRRMTLSADGRTLQGQATLVGGGGVYPLTWSRTSPLPPVRRYPDISGEWMEGSDHGVHISQNGSAFTATCTYGNVSWRMEGTVSPDGVVAGRLTHTAGVSQSATGFAQDRRMTLSTDGRTLQGQATFVGGGGVCPLTWTRTSPLPPAEQTGATPPQPSANAVRYRVEVLIYNSPDHYTNPRNWNDFLVDFSRCTVQSVSVPTLSVNVSVCRDRRRLTFSYSSGGAVIEQDWVFRDNGRIVAGAWRQGPGFGPVAGSILATDGSDNGWQTR